MAASFLNYSTHREEASMPKNAQLAIVEKSMTGKKMKQTVEIVIEFCYFVANNVRLPASHCMSCLCRFTQLKIDDCGTTALKCLVGVSIDVCNCQ